jgi:LysR family transcriptional activator of nhaA
MAWLNYHHLLYFHTVAREGSVVRAAERLHLTQPTVSGQIKTLEDALGERLFARVGRRLVLTDVGRLVYQYADEIFALGRELMDVLNDRPSGRPFRLVVGVADVMPKLVVRHLLEPALALPEGVHLVCREDKTDRLLASLALRELDVVLADSPVTRGLGVRAFSHLLGESGVTFLAPKPVADRLGRRFPASLDQAPMLLPTENTALRWSLSAWLATQRITPRLVAEFEDSALLNVFGGHGVGVFPVPSVIEAEVRRELDVDVVGHAPDVVERFYAISLEKKLQHPAVVAIWEGARRRLFSS